MTSLAAKDLGLAAYDPSRTHGHALLRSRVEAMHEELACLTTEGRAGLLIEPKRASVILGGSVILLEVMRFFDLGQIVVSERDILDGLVATLRQH